MELDNLRRQWQQQPADQPAQPLTPQTLQDMLAHEPTNPISQMTANAKRDLRMLVVVMIINVSNVINFTKRHFFEQVGGQVLLVLFLAMLVFTAWNLYARLRLLRQMQQDAPGTGLVAQLRRQMQQLVRLFRLHQRVGYVFAGVLVLTVGFVLRQRLLTPTGGIHWNNAWLGLLMVGVLLAIVAIGEAKQRRRYGQHLARLDAALRELADEKPLG